MYRVKISFSIMMILLLFNLFGNCFAYGEETRDCVSVSIGNASGTIGQEVVVPIDFSNVPSEGINNCDFRIKYDTQALELVSVDPGEIVTHNPIMYLINFAYRCNVDEGKISFLYCDVTEGNNPINSNGRFATIKFKIKSSALAGSYNLEKLKGGAFSKPDSNYGILPLDAVFTNGTVLVSSTTN